MALSMVTSLRMQATSATLGSLPASRGLSICTTKMARQAQPVQGALDRRDQGLEAHKHSHIARAERGAQAAKPITATKAIIKKPSEPCMRIFKCSLFSIGQG